ncbi:MAG: SH3 domain-containing protein [Caldilineaceae bacterium]|nr:SH3 domain-containing protein [Caldilineaceae bacterium]
MSFAPLRVPSRKDVSPHAPSRNLTTIHCLLLLTLLLAACGRRPAEPTPLPPGTPVTQPTPDFSAPAQVGSANQPTDQNTDRSQSRTAQSLATRLAQQRTQPTPTAPSSLTPGPSLLSSDPSLAVFSRPNALGILAGGGILYTAPNGAARANLQVGATLTITGRSADRAWFAAYLADGTAGWVPAAQVRVFGDASELETVDESLGPAVVATLIAQASQPQTPIVLPAATPTPAAPSDDAQSPATAAAAPTAAPEITGPAVTVIVEGANLRAGPGTDYPVVGGLYQDARAPLLGRNQSGDWLQLQLPDGPAWIYAPLVQTTTPIPDLPTIDPPSNN